MPGKGEPTSRELNLFMRGLVGHPGQRALNQLLLRSMMQAVYSPDQVGHYGLGAEDYLHFTSPIRRYPDLLVHRLLRANWDRGQRRRPERELEREQEELRRMAEHSSERERAAMKCEREVNALYGCLLMEDRVGEEFAATVSSITDFGFFVELDAEHIEGLVRADDLGPGHRLVVGALVWPNGRRVQVGQALTVRLAAVNVQRRQMDFDVVAFAGERPSRRRGGAERMEAERPEPTEARRTGPSAPHAGERKHGGRAGEAGRQRGRRAQGRGGPGEKQPRAELHPKGQARIHERRHGQAGGEQGQRHQGRELQPAETAQPTGSPHPGFDRLRALATRSRKSGGRSSSAPRARDDAGRRPGGRGDGGRGPSQPGSRGGKPAPGRDGSRAGGGSGSGGRTRRRRR